MAAPDRVDTERRGRTHHPGDLELIAQLRDEIGRLVADAASLAEETRAETSRVQALHDEELALLHQARDVDAEHFSSALTSRELVGQAKGVLMVTMGCSADRAFELLRMQSQHENRKLVDIATEVVERVSRHTAARDPDVTFRGGAVGGPG